MKDNAIPREARAGVVIRPEDEARFSEIVLKFTKDITDEFWVTDPNIKIECNIDTKEIKNATIIHPTDMERIIFMCVQSPNGVQTMSMEIPGLVESSLNLGVIRTDIENSKVLFSWQVRSNKKSLKYLLSDKLAYMTEFLGGTYWYEGDYPQWSYRSQSPLRELVQATYLEIFGKEARVDAVHAGLECGLISEKMPELDMVAIGPDMKDIHTPDEQLSIASTERSYRLLCEILKRIKG